MTPSGMRDTWIRIMPGVRKALNTFQRGHAPLKRAKRIPEALKRFEMLPATSMRIMWNGTPSAPGRRSVVRRCATCSNPTRKRRPSTSMSYRSSFAAWMNAPYGMSTAPAK